MNKEISLIASKIKQGGKNVVFTGAGISTESGIPDYRSQGGIWDKFRPVYLDEFMSSKDSREEYWRRWVALYQGIVEAQPNAAHLALAGLEKMGLLQAVITQNIDGLHQASGLADENIIELHGNTCRIRCMSCRKISPIDSVQQRLAAGNMAPECECGGYFKTGYDFFRPGHAGSRSRKSRRLFAGLQFFPGRGINPAGAAGGSHAGLRQK